MATDQEISDAAAAAFIDADHSNGTALLHCVSGYPTFIEEADLENLRWLKTHAHASAIGISDHTNGCSIPVAATTLGAVMIEKHLMLYKAADTEDFQFSMFPDQFANMVGIVRAIWQAMQPSERKSEESSRQARRSLYVVENIRAGEQFTEKNIRSIRPAYGLPPKELSWVLGKNALYNIERGTALTKEMVVSS